MDGRRLLFGIIGTIGVAAAVSPAAAQPVVAIDAVANQRERTELQSWIDTTTTVLRSQAFTDNLRALAAAHPRIFRDGARNRPSYTTIDEIVRMMGGTSGFRLVPVAVALSGDEGFFGGLTGWIGTTEADGSQSGSMTLYRGDLARWRSGNDVERSCAINTLAHEIGHTVSTEQIRFIHALTDYHRFDAPANVAAGSYLIGTVAQCTWLQQQGRVPANGLERCVAVFGTRHFNNRRCGKFAPGQAVEPRNGLPTEATDAELDRRP